MKLIEYLISSLNKSGSIKPAPNALKDLKSSIEGIPFALNQPSMSGLFNMNNIMQGLKILQKQMGGLENIGSFQEILQQINNGTVTLKQLEDALGNGGALATVLMNYQSLESIQQSTTLATGGNADVSSQESDTGPLYYTKPQVDAGFYDKDYIDSNFYYNTNIDGKFSDVNDSIANINLTLTNVVHYDSNLKISANGYSTPQGYTYSQYGTNLKFRGEEFEWGHLNSGGYGSVVGFENNTGKPYIAFGAGRGSSNNTYKTLGLLTASVIRANLDGTMTFGYLVANTDNQTLTPSFVVSIGANYSWGHLLPAVNASYDFGSNTARWRTIYTSDLDLNNGVGDWTIVEGEEDLFIYNNKNEKVYKFDLIEVDPSEATPKIKNAD